MKKIKKYLRFWLLFFLWLTCPAQAEENQGPETLYARSAVLMDADSGRILFEKNGEERLANASTTKILTCILALEKGEPEETVTFSEEAVRQPEVHLGASKGEIFYLEDLLYSLMLESHNDTAVAVAEAISGSTAAFAEEMNQKAKEIGCTETHFVSPNGLDWEDEDGPHETTAGDLARLLRYCIHQSPKKEEFLKITRTGEKSFSNLSGTRTYSCTNHNAFLSMMDGALTGKTGFTGKAGYCYTGALSDGDRTFIIALLACGWPNNKTYKWSDARALFSYGLSAYRYDRIELPGGFGTVSVKEGVLPGQAIDGKAEVALLLAGEKEFRLLLSGQDEVKWKVTLPKILEAPVVEGEQEGEAVLLLNGETIASCPVIAGKTVEKKDFTWCFLKIFEQYLEI
ncbi:MAG: D-alanyl-D-alanine carboxypeptidase [Blautia sp.]|nr:D-alanyl-D-alanine carboxypeptidase [Blautia sp.]